MDRVSQAILGRLHSVFDKDPEQTLALRIRHADGLTWVIDGYMLAVTTTSGTVKFDLTQHTLSTLAEALTATGIDVVFAESAVEHLNATILLEGQGDQGLSNGDHLQAYTSLLWVILGAMSPSYEEAKSAITSALAQLILPQSTQEWADLFGQIFGVARLTDEADADYTARMIDEIQRKRSNPAAIIQNVKRLTGYDVEVREPWKEIFTLSESRMDDDFHFQGAPIWQYHTAQLISRVGVKWHLVMPQAYADRPAGTLYLDPATVPYPAQIICGDMNVASSVVSQFADQIWSDKDGILSYNLSLSDYAITRQYLAARSDLHSYSGALITESIEFQPWLTFVKGEIVLSEAPPIGTLQGHFPGSTTEVFGRPLTLSADLGLSDYEYGMTVVPVDEWLDAMVTTVLPVNIDPPATSQVMMFAAQVKFMRKNYYLWDEKPWDSREWVDRTFGPMAITEYTT